MIKSHPSVTTSPEPGRTGNLLSKKADPVYESALTQFRSGLQLSIPTHDFLLTFRLRHGHW